MERAEAVIACRKGNEMAGKCVGVWKWIARSSEKCRCAGSCGISADDRRGVDQEILERANQAKETIAFTYRNAYSCKIQTNATSKHFELIQHVIVAIDAEAFRRTTEAASPETWTDFSPA
jgi:hypothetical protein